MGKAAGSRIILILAVFIAWTAATYLLEGRTNLLLRYDPAGRIIYTAVANIAIGVIFSAWTLRYLLKAGFVNPAQLGLGKPKTRTVSTIAAAGLVGFALFVMQAPRADPIIVVNVFLQVLPVSVAEVIVCWVVVGTAFESLSRRKGRIISITMAAVVSTVLFGLYHFAHSPPFNQPSMVLFLMIPGIATAVTFFLGRDIYAAIAIQNFLGMTGILANVDPNIFSQPMPPIYLQAAASMAALVASNVFLLRSARRHEIL